ncbi:Dockerin type I repeat protein [Roseimaritima multifibrata]|uniref:Dockerin type I repeat protein n=1 Tax=Roseimaritima multifibrata TaxID=1930274 RepID=A0A517MF71_9BACT|nr:dockerin type I domain-containing protein [Roseimaritima multifibrata]QDS93496.1 Dockerin type I repeat protein [Roseimaritima multifibrata]
MFLRPQERQIPRRKRLQYETLCKRNLFAGDVFISEDFQDQSADGFAPIFSNTVSNGIVEVADGEYAYQSVFDSNETQTLLGNKFGATDGVELSYRVKFPDGIPRNSSEAHDFIAVKLSRLVAPDGTDVEHNLQNELSVFRNPDGSSYYQLLFFAEKNGTADRVDIDFSPDQWIDIRYRVTFNSPGLADGSLVVWVNGVEEVRRNEMVWADAVTDRPDSFWVGGPLTMRGIDPASPMRRQLDDIKLVTNPSSTETPPLAEWTAVQRDRYEDGRTISELLLEGTDRDDSVALNGTSTSLTVTDGVRELMFAGVDRVLVDLGEGDDFLDVERSLAGVIGTISNTESIDFVIGQLPDPSDPSRFDVNGDGHVTPLDALHVVNAINRNDNPQNIDSEFNWLADVSRDGFISAKDALQVINFLNTQVSVPVSSPDVVEYTSFQGETVSRYAYEGKHVTLLAKSPNLAVKDIDGLIAEIDRGYEVYAQTTGLEPSDYGLSVGKTIIAQVDQTCGAGCGYLGVRGIEVDTEFFDVAVEEFASSGTPDHLFFYELGRNFWFYQSKLEFNDLRSDHESRGSGDFMVNGFPILMERAISEFLEIPFSGPPEGAGTPASQASMARWLDTYTSDPEMNFDSVFLDFEGSLYNDPLTVAGNIGTMDYFSEIMLDLAREYGELEFLKRFWQEVGKRPDLTDVDSAISNLVDAASIAAGEDLHDRFINKYKWNTIRYTSR